MKKLFALSLVVLLTMSLFVGCGAKDATDDTIETDEITNENDDTTNSSELEDGIYFAVEDTDSNWKYTVTLEVVDGEIVEVDWNGANVNGGKDKKTSSIDGEYAMGGDEGEWHEQAAVVEAYLLETQDPTAISYSTEDGNTDDIAGASIKVSAFFELAEEALANGPVGTGNWEDGAFHAEEADFSGGYKYAVDFTVINGFIVTANWDGIAEEGDMNKKELSLEGEYVMGGDLEWHEQAAAVEAYLIETQDPTAINYSTEDGRTDDVAGASIKVSAFFELAEEALQAR